MLGFRNARDVIYYRHDPLLKRVLGAHELPDVAILTRQPQRMDERGVERMHGLVRRLVLDWLSRLALARLMTKFDGFVLSTARRAEGAAVS